MTRPIDTVDLAQRLIRCASVTPQEGGALTLLQQTLSDMGFHCHRLPFSSADSDPVDNLYARYGEGRPHFCFAGHTDVVPVGEHKQWSHDPFAAVIEDGHLFGRGAVDMKSAIAGFTAAAARFLARQDGSFTGSISLLITGDEEGPAINGTKKMLTWLQENNQVIDHCLVGEPTNPQQLGEMIKIGRRGSLTGRLTVQGTQGHVAYPHLADNPVPRALAMLSRLAARQFPQDNAHFQPTNLEITTIDVGNAASNVIPATVTAQFNIRFNTDFSGQELADWARAECAAIGGAHELDIHISGEPFLCTPSHFTFAVRDAVEAVTGRRPEFSTTGGTSDARFIKDLCPVCEFGLVGRTMHKVDECVAVDDIVKIEEIYFQVLQRYFA